jgi:hypothetical protein
MQFSEDYGEIKNVGTSGIQENPNYHPLDYSMGTREL